eukprot:jgi/Mesvir1/19252/Mv06961-RA.1
MKVAELRQQLADQGLGTEGLKGELVDRLFAALTALGQGAAEPDRDGSTRADASHEPAQSRPRWRQQQFDKWMPPGLSLPEDDGNPTGLELLFLGTSSGSPTIRRNVTSIALRLPQSVWLVDCGEATQHRMLRTLLRPGKVTRVFVTHLHGDHVFGIPGLLCSISNSRPASATDPVYLYGPPGLGELILTCLKISQTQLSMPGSANSGGGYGSAGGYGGSIKEGEALTWTLVADDQGWGVCAGQLNHRVQCFGYVLKEADLVGRMQMDRVAAMGLTPGPLLKKLKASMGSGDEPVVQASQAAQGAGPHAARPQAGRAGDTSNSAGIAELARDADVLVHEATFENELYDKALQAGHSTAGMAGAFAASINARSLILTHFSARYTFGRPEEPSEAPREGGEGMSWQDDDRTTAVLVRQAQATMGSENVIAARDFLRVGIRRMEEAVTDADVAGPVDGSIVTKQLSSMQVPGGVPGMLK